MSILALVPARKGSRGVPGKNFRELGGKPLWLRAATCAHQAGIDELSIVLTTDRLAAYGMPWLLRPAELAREDTPMIAVVQHALQQIPGQPEDIIVLLQPTQPFRKPEHVQQAMALLRESGADSVVSVVPLPLTHHADAQLVMGPQGILEGYGDWPEFPRFVNRQQRRQTYIRDGTCYVFRRSTVERYGHLYGARAMALIIDPADSCELDTEADWAEVERRWRERHG